MKILKPNCPRGGRHMIRKRVVTIGHDIGLHRICVKCGKLFGR